MCRRAKRTCLRAGRTLREGMSIQCLSSLWLSSVPILYCGPSSLEGSQLRLSFYAPCNTFRFRLLKHFWNRQENESEKHTSSALRCRVRERERSAQPQYLFKGWPPVTQVAHLRQHKWWLLKITNIPFFTKALVSIVLALLEQPGVSFPTVCSFSHSRLN